MFSFGGFSSILPYIGYLSVMRICIIIGLSGHVNTIFGIFGNRSYSVETTLCERKCPEQSFYIKSLQSEPKKARGLFAASLFSTFQFIAPPLINYSDVGFKILAEEVIALNGLRAPPPVI